MLRRRINAATRSIRYLALFFVPSPAALIIGLLAEHGELLPAATLATLTLGGMLVLYKMLVGGQVSVGRDGVGIEGFSDRPRFIPFDRIKRARVRDATENYLPRGVEIQLLDGDVIYLPRVIDHPQVAAKIQERLAEYRQSVAAEQPTQLESARGDLRACLASVVAATEQKDYRTKPLSPQILVRVAEDPKAGAPERVVAAVAAARAGGGEIVQRIRVAAGESANAPLGKALGRAADGVLAENVIELAVKRTAAERARG